MKSALQKTSKKLWFSLGTKMLAKSNQFLLLCFYNRYKHISYFGHTMIPSQ